jgi:hypothetical protein
MIIIISVKKLTRQEKRLIKNNYSLLQYNRSHQNKKYDQIGKADVLLFELDIGFMGHYNNNHVVKYLHSQALKNIKVVYLYDNDKYRRIFTDVDYFIRKLPLFKGKTLMDKVVKQERIEGEERKKQKEADALKKKQVSAPPQKKNVEMKIVELKNQIDTLQKSLDKLLMKPQPKEPEETKQKYEMVIQKDCVMVKCGSKVIENASYKNRIEKRHAIHQFQDKYDLHYSITSLTLPLVIRLYTIYAINFFMTVLYYSFGFFFSSQLPLKHNHFFCFLIDII